MRAETARPVDLTADGATLLQRLAAGALNSDHAPLACEVPGLGAVVTYNVMTRMRAEGGRVNNGFAASETPAEYEARVRRLAQELGQLARGGVAAITLQETPGEPRLIGILSEALAADWRALASPTFGERFAQLVLFPSSRLRAIPQDLGPLGPQTGRVQVVALAAPHGAEVTLANVHLKWGVPCDEALRALAARRGALVVCGDFNRSPASLTLPGAACAVPEQPTSIKHTPEGPAPNAVDGFLLRL